MLETTSSSIDTKTRKIKKTDKHKNYDDKKLWNVFDEGLVNVGNKKRIPLELIYDKCIGNKDYCERCSSTLSFSEEGFLTCMNDKCGIIYKDVIDQTAEWRYYGADDNQNSDPTRCGMPINPLLKESSFGCKVLCNGPVSYEMRKIRQYTEWQSMPYKEKSQYEEFQRITIMAQNSGIPKMIIDDAIRYYKKISEYKTTFRGDNRDGILSASVYISCRINNYPRTAKEIATIFNLDVQSATKGCKNAQLIINNIEKDLTNSEKTLFCKTKPALFIERFCSKLNINNDMTKLCQFIAIKIEDKCYMPENTPHSIAAGIVYFIIQLFDLNITKKSIKNVSEISEVTINKCFKKIEKYKKELIPAAIIQKYNLLGF
jgi:transcription initiation factor TFIIB